MMNSALFAKIAMFGIVNQLAKSNDGTRITLTNARNVSPSASLQDMQTSSKPSVHIPGIVVMRTPHGK